MIYKIYSIFDSKAESYTLPFFQQTEPMAIRTFADWCNDPNHTFGKHPEDYTLFESGTYDDSTGTITQNKISSITNGITLKEPSNAIS